MSEDRMKIFRLYQHHETVTLGEGEDRVTVVMWKPTNEQASRGQLYLLERMEHWQREGETVVDGIESTIQRMSKDELVTQIIDQSAAHKVAENLDLVPEEVRNSLEQESLIEFTKNPEYLDSTFGLQPGGAVALEQAAKLPDFKREHIMKLIRNPEAFEEMLDAVLTEKVEEKFRESESKQYSAASRKDLEETLEQINARTVAYGMALREWARLMITLLTRYPADDPGLKGDPVFSEDEDAPDYIGNVSEEVFQRLTESLGKIMTLGRTEQVRRLAEDVNFPVSATSPKTSDSLPQDAPPPPTLQITPSTS